MIKADQFTMLFNFCEKKKITNFLFFFFRVFFFFLFLFFPVGPEYPNLKTVKFVINPLNVLKLEFISAHFIDSTPITASITLCSFIMGKILYYIIFSFCFFVSFFLFHFFAKSKPFLPNYKFPFPC